MDFQIIDKKALALAKDFKRCEVELLNIIALVDKHRVYYQFGCNSLFQYVVKRLELSEAQAYTFINVARKAREVPELKTQIQSGALTVSKAKRVTSVITLENQDHWIKLAQSESQRTVEREVALAAPQKVFHEKLQFVSQDDFFQEKVRLKKEAARIKLELGISEQLMLQLRRAQDLVSQKKRGSANLESTLEAVLSDFISRNDPVEKAKRQSSRLVQSTQQQGVKTKTSASQNQVIDAQPPHRKSMNQEVIGNPPPHQKPLSQIASTQKAHSRKAISASLKHQVPLRDEGRCCSVDDKGVRCSSQRFLENHHIHPLADGGLDTLDNLTLLCSGHHKGHHQKELT